MFSGTGQRLTEGDSAVLAAHAFETSFGVQPDAPLASLPYFAQVDPADPLVNPMGSPELLAKFPPSLLVTGTRAFEMAAMIDAHNKLVLAGARSQLHVWDGLWHTFYANPDLPESREFEQIVVRFFAEHLGGAR